MTKTKTAGLRKGGFAALAAAMIFLLCAASLRTQKNEEKPYRVMVNGKESGFKVVSFDQGQFYLDNTKVSPERVGSFRIDSRELIELRESCARLQEDLEAQREHQKAKSGKTVEPINEIDGLVDGIEKKNVEIKGLTDEITAQAEKFKAEMKAERTRANEESRKQLALKEADIVKLKGNNRRLDGDNKQLQKDLATATAQNRKVRSEAFVKDLRNPQFHKSKTATGLVDFLADLHNPTTVTFATVIVEVSALDPAGGKLLAKTTTFLRDFKPGQTQSVTCDLEVETDSPETLKARVNVWPAGSKDAVVVPSK